MSNDDRLFTYSPGDLQLPSNEPSSLTPFDLAFRARWQRHMDDGHFRYPFTEAKMRALEGTNGFVLQNIPDRASNRRKPQVYSSH